MEKLTVEEREMICNKDAKETGAQLCEYINTLLNERITAEQKRIADALPEIYFILNDTQKQNTMEGRLAEVRKIIGGDWQ